VLRSYTAVLRSHFFLLLRRPPRPTLFPYTTLFIATSKEEHLDFGWFHAHRVCGPECHDNRYSGVDLVDGFLLGKPSVAPLVLFGNRRHHCRDQHGVSLEPNAPLKHRVLKQPQRRRKPKTFSLPAFHLGSLDHFIGWLAFLRPALRMLDERQLK